MKTTSVGRRGFLAGLAGSFALSKNSHRVWPQLPRPSPRIRFSVVGLNHAHINGMTDAVIRGGGELVAVYAREPDLTAAFVKRYPQVTLAGSEKEILESTVPLILSAAIPDERAPLGIRV